MNLDFDILWKIGRAIIAGADPYSVPYSYYPPAAAYFLAVLGIFPKEAAFILLTTGNLSSLLYMLMNKAIPYRSIAWVFYTPLIYALGVGQLDLLLLGCFYLTEQPGWISVIAACLLTLKPQVAFIALPWILFQWLKHSKKKLAAWALLCSIMHLFPILLDRDIYARWFAAISQVSGGYSDTTPGLFSLVRLGVPVWALVLASILLIIAGIKLGKVESLLAQTLALPFGYWYNLVLLVGNVPWQLCVPISMLAFYLSYFVFHSFAPMLIIPLSAVAWRIAKRTQKPAMSYQP